MIKDNDKEIAKQLSQFYHKINFVFHAVLAPPILCMLWLYLEVTAQNVTPVLKTEFGKDVIGIFLPIMSLIFIGLAFFAFKKVIGSINPKLALLQKISIYKSISFVLYGLLEVSVMLSVAGYYLTQSSIFIVIFMIVLIFFSLYKPTLYRIAKHLNIRGEDKHLLINCRAIDRGDYQIH